jgi:hypothetical protein
VDPEAGAQTETIDVGFNYIIDGFNSRVMVAYTNTDTAGADTDAFVIGYQFQY